MRVRNAEATDEERGNKSLLAIRGLQSAGWDAFENPVRAIDATVRLHNETDDNAAAAHLRLWIYGHIVEASEPHELVANLLDVLGGGAFNTRRLPTSTADRSRPAQR